LSTRPKDANAFMALGNFYAATGKPEEAEKNFLTSVELAPKSVPIACTWGTSTWPGEKGQGRSVF